MTRPSWNRRDFLRFAGLAVTAAGTVGFAGCGGEDTAAAVGVPDPRATPQRDRAIINGALTLEHTAVAAYGMGLPLLRGDVRRYAERFLDQEREHAGALAALVREMEGEPNRPKPEAEYRAAFPRLRRPGRLPALRHRPGERGHHRLRGGHPQARRRRGCARPTASIFCDEAQHAAVLRGERSGGDPARHGARAVRDRAG